MIGSVSNYTSYSSTSSTTTNSARSQQFQKALLAKLDTNGDGAVSQDFKIVFGNIDACAGKHNQILLHSRVRALWLGTTLVLFEVGSFNCSGSITRVER